MDKSHPTYNADTPINNADNDLLGRAEFARNLAQCIQDVETKEGGYVISLCGPWGSGKSSIINLIKSNLKIEPSSGSVKVDEFSCLYTQNEVALLNRYIQTINNFAPKGKGITKENSNKFYALLENPILQFAAAQTLERAIDLVSLSPSVPSGEFEQITSGIKAIVASLWSKCIKKQVKSSKDSELELGLELERLKSNFENEGNKKFVLFIDDIDRLPPAQIINIFRLVKTLGDLPNLVTVLAYDDDIVKKLFAEKYKAEGEVFMDKMVQSTFYIPPLGEHDISRLIDHYMGSFLEGHNLLHGENRLLEAREIIDDLITTPRDIIRLQNNLQLIRNSKVAKLNKYDLLVLEALKIKRPEFYDFIRKEGASLAPNSRLQVRKKIFLDVVKERLKGLRADEKRMFARVISFLFPSASSLFDADIMSSSMAPNRESSIEKLDADRSLASPNHFQSYFSLALSENVLPFSDSEELLAAATGYEKLHDFLSRKLEVKTPGDHFDLLMNEFRQLPLREGWKFEHFGEYIFMVIFDLGDDILLYYQNQTNKTGEQAVESIFDLLEVFNIRGLPMPIKDRLFRTYMRVKSYGTQYKQEGASPSLVWRCIFSDRAFSQYHPRPGSQSVNEEDCYCSQALTEEQRVRFNSHLEMNIGKRIASHPSLGAKLFDIWSDNGRNCDRIKQFTSPLLKDDKFVCDLVKAFWVFDGTPILANGNYPNKPRYPSEYVDMEEFEKRTQQILKYTSPNEEDRHILTEYWRLYKAKE